MSKLPSVFIGSSAEDIEIARALQVQLDRDSEIPVWDQGFFELSKTTIDSLTKGLDAADFAILVFTGDDLTRIRGTTNVVARDNVIFEYGLSIGRLGLDRCYSVVDESQNLTLPTDLLGVTIARYRPRESGDLIASVGPACTLIRRRIKDLGFRPKVDLDELSSHQGVRDFCSSISGYWWERIFTDEESAISYFRIEPEPAISTVRMLSGRGCALDGSLNSRWESQAVCVKKEDRKVFYYWKGWHPAKPGEPFEGFGEFQFRESEVAVSAGHGLFYDSNLVRLEDTKRKSVELRRCSDPEEQKAMEADDRSTIRSLVVAKLREW